MTVSPFTFVPMKRWIRNLVIGKQRYYNSWTEYRQVMLSGQYGVIAICTLLFFSIVSLIRKEYAALPAFALGIGSVMLAIRYHRIGHHCLANSILYPSLIVIVYFFSSSEAPANGAGVFFIPISLGAFASFGYKHRKLSLMVAAFAAFMFLAATFLDFSPLPWRDYSREETLLNLLVYFSVALPTCLLTIYMLIRLNHRHAKQLVESNGLLKKSNEELDRFVYSTSHDLRAPLTSLLGLINISERTENLTDLRMYSGLMRDRVEALDRFIKDITDYSRNNRTEVCRVYVNLHEFVAEIWESLRYSHKAETIHFELNCPENFNIETDPHRLRVILTNLISNSIRYHDNRKAYKYIRLTCQKTEKSFVVSIQDNGQGISPEYHSKIFQMFFRANECSSGSGLGLYIVKEAIQKLSGEVQLQSALAQGSTFTVSLPAR